MKQQSDQGDTRTALLAAALRVLTERGIDGATSRAITQEAGANLQSITYHFGSKDALVSEALVGALKRWLEPALNVLRTDSDPVRRMMAAVSELQRAFERAREEVPAYMEALANAQRNPVVARALRDVHDEIHDFVSAQIADLKRRRVVPRWVDPDAMATLQIAAADGLAIHAVLYPDRVDPKAIGKQASRLLIAARKRRVGSQQ